MPSSWLPPFSCLSIAPPSIQRFSSVTSSSAAARDPGTFNVRLEELKQEIRTLLAQFVAEVEASVADGTDISSASEIFLLELFREVFEMPGLKSLNLEKSNFPGLDLGDDSAGVGFQITADPGLPKVLETLKTVVKYELYKVYPRVHIYITTRKQGSYGKQSIDRAVGDKLTFDPKKDVLDFRDLSKRFRGVTPEKLERIAEVLRRHIGRPKARTSDPSLAEAVERDFTQRYRQAHLRAPFPENSSDDLFRPLAEEVLARAATVSETLRRRILFRASRTAAARGRVSDAQRFFTAGAELKGVDQDLTTRAFLAEAEGDVDAAIRLLRDQQDPESAGVLLAILARGKGDEAALAWLTERCLSPARLGYVGIIALSQIYFRQDGLGKLREALNELSESLITDCPYLLFLRGAVQLASVFPKSARGFVFGGIPLVVRSAEPNLSDSLLVERLDGAIADFDRLLPMARELGLPAAAQVSESVALWARLLHPHRRDAARRQLSADGVDPPKATRTVQYLLAFDRSFDPGPLGEWLARRESLGGLADDELRAVLVLRLHTGRPAEVAELLGRYRARYQKMLGDAISLSIEVQALARANDSTSARLRLQKGQDALDAAVRVSLEAEIEAAEGSDPVATYARLYETTRTPDALKALVRELLVKGDHQALAKYAELLYGDTGDERDIAVAAQAYIRAGDDKSFVRVIESHRFLLERDREFKRHYAWEMLQAGRHVEASEIVAQLRAQGSAARDLNLESAVAIDTGNWDLLAAPLAAYLAEPARFDAKTLLRAAHLAQASGYAPFEELLNAALAKDNPDAEVLVGAYTIAVEGGLEDRRPETHEWFRRALEASGPEGPIQRFELKEVFKRHIEWTEYSRKINEAIVKGDMPLSVAASGLRTTIVEVVLGNFVRNATIEDPRQRSAIPLFSGRRVPSRVGDIKRIALDVTAVMTLGWMGILGKVLSAFSQVVLPGGLFFELFDGLRRAREFQRTRLARARELQRLLATRLRPVRPVIAQSDPLALEVGADLAGLLRSAEAASGVVVRPAPVKRLGIDEDRPADLSAFSHQLADTHALLKALRALGAVDQPRDEAAEQYFKLQDAGWDASAAIQKDTPLYLDELAVSYLQTTRLLPIVAATFDNVYVHVSVQEEAAGIEDLERRSSEIAQIIDGIRTAVRTAADAGTVQFAPRTEPSEPEGWPEPSIQSLLSNLLAVDALVSDDRALNKELYAVDRSNHRALLVNTLDLIEELCARGILNDSEKRAARHRLRIGGAVLMPADADEIQTAALRSVDFESAEFRAIRESIDLARIRKVVSFPAEAPWFAAVTRASKDAVISLWAVEKNRERAAALADLVLGIRPNAADWVACWGDQVPPQWAETVSRVMTASLALPLELTDAADRSAYNDWLEKRLLEALRATAPDHYAAMVEYVKTLILGVGEARRGE